jgi:hypothetical protein
MFLCLLLIRRTPHFESFGWGLSIPPSPSTPSYRDLSVAYSSTPSFGVFWLRPFNTPITLHTVLSWCVCCLFVDPSFWALSVSCWIVRIIINICDCDISIAYLVILILTLTKTHWEVFVSVVESRSFGFILQLEIVVCCIMRLEGASTISRFRRTCRSLGCHFSHRT